MTITHANITPGDIHVPYSFLYTDATAKDAATNLTEADIGKLARQIDNNSLWMLTATTPSITWTAVGGAALGDIHASDVVFEVDGFITSTTVQGALLELDNEKAPLLHTHYWDGVKNFSNVGLDVLMDAKIETSLMGVADGVATLAPDGKLVVTQLPAISITNTTLVADEAAMLTLTAQTGDVAIRTDLSKTFILKGTDASILSHWEWLKSPTDATASDIPYTPSGGDVTAATLQGAIDQLNTNKISNTEKGAPGGVATLDPITGLVVEMPALYEENPNGPAGSISYIPTTVADWTTYVVDNFKIANALDELAARDAANTQYNTTQTITQVVDSNIANIQANTDAIAALVIPTEATDLSFVATSTNWVTNPSNVNTALEELAARKATDIQYDTTHTITQIIDGNTADIQANTDAIAALVIPTNTDALDFTTIATNWTDWTTEPANVTEALNALATRQADSIGYTPTVSSNWTPSAPSNISAALDQLAVAVGDAAYTPTRPADWNGTPTSAKDAIDRIAYLLATHLSTTIPQLP